MCVRASSISGIEAITSPPWRVETFRCHVLLLSSAETKLELSNCFLLLFAPSGLILGCITVAPKSETWLNLGLALVLQFVWKRKWQNRENWSRCKHRPFFSIRRPDSQFGRVSFFARCPGLFLAVAGLSDVGFASLSGCYASYLLVLVLGLAGDQP
ncbi:hypothetical protein GGI43DRAFT_170043 [Trichoderma evansii]